MAAQRPIPPRDSVIGEFTLRSILLDTLYFLFLEKKVFLPSFFSSLQEQCYLLLFLFFTFRIRAWVNIDPLKYYLKLYVL